MAFQKKPKIDPRVKPKTRAKKSVIQPSKGETFVEWVQSEFTDAKPTPLAPPGGQKDFLDEQAKEAAAKAQALPLLAFEPQLARINRILHHWLRTVDGLGTDDLPIRIDMITKLTRGLHENLRLTTDAIRLLHEIHDVRTFNRVVLEAIQEVEPDLRIKIIRRLQQAHGMIKVLPAGGALPESIAS